MLRTRSAGTPDGRRPGTNSRLGDHRLTGTDGTAIDGLSGNRRDVRLGNSGPGRGRLRRHSWSERRQSGGKVGTRRHHRPRGGLTRQRTLGQWARHGHRRPGSGAGGFSGGFAPDLGGSLRMRARDGAGARCFSRRSRERLPRSGQNLARFGPRGQRLDRWRRGPSWRDDRRRRAGRPHRGRGRDLRRHGGRLGFRWLRPHYERMNRAYGQRRTNRGRGANLPGGEAAGLRSGPCRGMFGRAFPLGLGNGWG